MIDSTSLLLFLGANFIVLITPGPAVMYTVTRSLDQGRRAGLMSVYGLALGTLPHALAVAFGVAGLLASSLFAFAVMKYLGAAYLIYLGIRQFRRRAIGGEEVPPATRSDRAAFVDSFVVGVTNPKSVMFFMAFLPQFVDPSLGNPMLQTLVLWSLSQVMAVMVGSAYALAAAWLGGWSVTKRSLAAIGDYFAGTVYIGLGLLTAFAGPRK
jgi:threonine/homoserine/homoserine lactone efflux protein